MTAGGGREQVVGVGIDVCSVRRLGEALGRTPGLSQRLFTPGEQLALDERRAAGGDAEATTCASMMFAVKEAVMKSLGAGFDKVPFSTIEVDLSGPAVVLHAEAAARAAASGAGAFVVDVEILDGPVGPAAVAEVLALGDGPV